MSADRKALAELVACKDISLEMGSVPYDRELKAWATARAALEGPPGPVATLGWDTLAASQGVNPAPAQQWPTPSSEPERPEPVAWVPVAERMPASGVTVLACYTNSAGKWRRIRAMWIAAKSYESGPESDMGEYDEDTDCYCDPEGWYEKIDNWPEYTACSVNEGVVSHWMPLPAAPGATTPAPQPLNDALLDRIERALERHVYGHAARRIPADMSDSDIVLYELRAARAALSAAQEQAK
jgi:hypothetical protein